MEGAPTRRIAEVVNKCPTQAIVWKNNSDLTSEELSAQKHPGKEEENPETITSDRIKPASIRIMKDGPIVVDGLYKVIGIDDKELKPTQMTSFCRCGHSRSMPYCDGTHRKVGFSE